MLDQAGALVSPGTDSGSSISPDFGGNRRSRRRHKKRSKRAAQLLVESLDSATEIKSSPEHYTESRLEFHSVHNILHPESPEEGSASASQGFNSLSHYPEWQAGIASIGSVGQQAGLEGFLHAARSGQGGLFQAEALRRTSQDSNGVWLVQALQLL